MGDKIQQAAAQDEHLQWLKVYIIADWSESKDQIHQDIRAYRSFKDDLAVIDGVIMKVRHVVIPERLKGHVLDQLYINHMSTEKQNY